MKKAMRLNRFIPTAIAIACLALLACTESGPTDEPEVDVTVTFDSRGGGAIPAQTVHPGTAISEPNNLANGALIFGGWYKEAACENPWHFDTDTATRDRTLYAKWLAADSLTMALIGGGTAYEVTKGASDPTGAVYIPAYYMGIPVTSIGYQAFRLCANLSSVVIPEGITTIAEYAFYFCTGLTSLSIPSSVTSIPIDALFYCNSLRGITVSPGNTQYSSIDGVLLDKSATTLLCYPSARPVDSYTVPSGVVTIAEYAFSNSKTLHEVILPAGLTTIEYNAFGSCNVLTAVSIPPSVTSIGMSSFASCWILENIFIPSSVTSMGESVFLYCNTLTIHCQAKDQPSGWNVNWNSESRPVIWGASS